MKTPRTGRRYINIPKIQWLNNVKGFLIELFWQTKTKFYVFSIKLDESIKRVFGSQWSHIHIYLEVQTDGLNIFSVFIRLTTGPLGPSQGRGGGGGGNIWPVSWQSPTASPVTSNTLVCFLPKQAVKHYGTESMGYMYVHASIIWEMSKGTKNFSNYSQPIPTEYFSCALL